MRLNETSIYTEPLKFSPDSFPTNPPLQSEPIPDVGDGEVGGEGDDDVENGSGDGDGGAQGDPEEKEEKEEEGMLEDEDSPPWITDDRRLRRRQWDLIDSITSGVKGASDPESDAASTGLDSTDSSQRQDEGGGGEGNTVYEVPTYSGAIHYKVPKTGYYCVGKSLPFPLRLHHPSTLPPAHPPLPPPPHLLAAWLNPPISPLLLFMTEKMVKKLTSRDRTSNSPKPTFHPSPLLRLLARPRKETSKPRRIFRLRPV